MKKDEDNLIEDKRKDKVQRAHTRRNPKRHIPLVSLLLWHKMVAMCCFIWPPALRLWSGRQAGSQMKIQVSVIFLNSISGCDPLNPHNPENWI